MRLPPRRTRRFAPCLAALAGLLASCAASAQHPGHQPQWPDPAPAPCADIADGPRRDACLARAEARKAAEDAASRRYHLWLADRLAEDGGARNLAIAANLRAMSLIGEIDPAISASALLDGDKKLARWLARATYEGRDDTVVLLFLYRAFGAHDTARRASVLARWREIEPENLYPILLADDAHKDDVQGYLDDAKHATYSRSHYLEVLRTALAAFAKHPPKDSLADVLFDEQIPNRETYVFLLLEETTPAPRGAFTVQACKGEQSLSIPGRREACIRFGRILAETSDTWGDSIIGSTILRYSAEDENMRAAYEAKQRRTAWAFANWRFLAKTRRGAFYETAARYIADNPLAYDETTVMGAISQAFGESLDPPANWPSPPK